MATSRMPPVSALLVAAFAVGWLAVISRPDGILGSEMWPVGLAAGALLLARGTYAVGTAVAVGLIGFASFALGGRPLDFAACAGVAIAAEALVIKLILTDRGARPAALVDGADLSRFVVAVAAGAGVAGVLLGLASSLITDGPPLLIVLGTAAGHMSSALVLLPFMVHTGRHPAVARPAERAFHWLILLAITLAVFTPPDFPSLIFLVMPVLGWTALRCGLRETQLQLLAVATVATLLTSFGLGPLAEQQGSYALPEYVLGVVLQAFVIGCALVAIPLSLAVGQQLAAFGRSEREGRLLRRVIESADVAIIGADATGRINLFNPGAERILGYGSEEVMGRSTRLLHTDDAISDKASELGVADDFGAVAMRLTEPDHAGDHMRFRRKDGTERTHAMTLSALRDSRGTITGFVCSSADVAQEVAARQALLDALDTERRAVQRAQEVDEAKELFVTSVSHELRTPITSIIGYLEMLVEGEFGDLETSQQLAVRRIDANSKRLLSLIDELLTLSRVHEHHVGDRTPLDLREVAGLAFDVVAPSWAQRDLHAELCLPSDEVMVEGNRELLERVTVNLVGNAAKFTQEGGELTVAVDVHDGSALLTVRDTGIGIPLEEQQHLFTRFFRSSLAQHHAIQGSGLGLSIAHAIVEEHGGTFEVVSAPGVGTTFSVRLPLHQSQNVQGSTRVGSIDA